jgi:4-hydroxybenzoate polyprenyltransferase
VVPSYASRSERAERRAHNRLRALIALTHPGPSVATVLAALAFLPLLAHGRPPLATVATLGAMLLCQQVAISLHNDYCDRALDTVAKPWRAIPSGAVRPRAVLAGAVLLVLASLALAASISPLEFLLDLIGLAAGLSYNAWLKRTWWSWLPFAIAFPLLPLFGAAALDPAHLAAPLVAGCFLVGAPLAVAIHLADTMPDLTSDLAGGVRGLAHHLGPHTARRLSVALFAWSIPALVIFLLWLYRQQPS